MAAKKSPSTKAPAKQVRAKKEIDPSIVGKATVMVRNGKSMEAVEMLVSEAKITTSRAQKIVYAITQAL